MRQVAGAPLSVSQFSPRDNVAVKNERKIRGNWSGTPGSAGWIILDWSGNIFWGDFNFSTHSELTLDWSEYILHSHSHCKNIKLVFQRRGQLTG